MKVNKIIYIDTEKVSQQIKDTINVEKYGEIIFRKIKLKNHHEKIYAGQNKYEFNYISKIDQIDQICNQLSYADANYYIIQTSNFVIVDPQNFRTFLEKIEYVPSSLAVAEYDNAKGYLKLNKQEAITFLKTLETNGIKEALSLINSQKTIEKLNLEKFFIQVDNYSDLIRLFQSSFELRYFNSIEKKENVITKKSKDKKKMFAEFNLYSLLDEKMKLYFLPTFDFQDHEDHASYSLERLHIPDVSLQWIHFSFSDEEFERLINKLFDFINIRSKKNVDLEALTKINDNYFVEKVKERFEALKAHPKFDQLNRFLITASGIDPISKLYDTYYDLYYSKKDSILKLKHLSMSHGDLCFSNMIYDKRINMLKLIDPRGGKTADDLFLPTYYDLAKLSHSVMGKYDFINNGLFDFTFSEDLTAKLSMQHLEHFQNKEQLFKEKLKENGFDYSTVRLLEASLFLSMLPLHIDNPKKVSAFYLNAKQIISEIQ